MTIKTFETMRGATPEPMVASGVSVKYSFAAHQHLSVSEIPENQRYREHLEIKVLLVGLWHSNVSAPSARKNNDNCHYRNATRLPGL